MSVRVPWTHRTILRYCCMYNSYYRLQHLSFFHYAMCIHECHISHKTSKNRGILFRSLSCGHGNNLGILGISKLFGGKIGYRQILPVENRNSLGIIRIPGEFFPDEFFPLIEKSWWVLPSDKHSPAGISGVRNFLLSSFRWYRLAD